MKIFTNKWLKAAGIRALRTFAQTANVITTLEGNVDGYSYNWAGTSTFKRKIRYLSNPDVYAFYRRIAPTWMVEKAAQKQTSEECKS